jgi:hypothetical protein
MCNRFVQNGRVVKPGEKATVLLRGPAGEFEIEFDQAVFSGNAREDKKRYWLRQADEVIVPGISAYGEKHKVTGAQSFEEVPEGSKMLGFLLPQPEGKQYRLLKILTTDGGPIRTALFGNDRTPVLEPPLSEEVGKIETEAPPTPPKEQMELL